VGLRARVGQGRGHGRGRAGGEGGAGLRGCCSLLACGWPAELQLYVLSETLAIAAPTEAFGTLLRLDRAAGGQVLGFTWTRADEATCRGRRR
jgi:hypothetical protein